MLIIRCDFHLSLQKGMVKKWIVDRPIVKTFHLPSNSVLDSVVAGTLNRKKRDISCFQDLQQKQRTKDPLRLTIGVQADVLKLMRQQWSLKQIIIFSKIIEVQQQFKKYNNFSKASQTLTTKYLQKNPSRRMLQFKYPLIKYFPLFRRMSGIQVAAAAAAIASSLSTTTVVTGASVAAASTAAQIAATVALASNPVGWVIGGFLLTGVAVYGGVKYFTKPDPKPPQPLPDIIPEDFHEDHEHTWVRNKGFNTIYHNTQFCIVCEKSINKQQDYDRCSGSLGKTKCDAHKHVFCGAKGIIL